MNNDIFFRDVVFGWMCKDIEREIELAKSNGDAGNVLCALALMAYTEFMGKHLPPSKCSDKKYFSAFLKELGTEYEELLKKVDVYRIFRCELIHAYSIDHSCTITMLNTLDTPFEVAGQPPVSIQRPVCCGIGDAGNGSYYFVVEKYLDDFRNACRSLQSDLAGSRVSIAFNKRITSDSG